MATSATTDDLDLLRSNAWCGEAASGALAADSAAWGTRSDFAPPQQSRAPPPLNLDQWQHPQVGWGVVLADRDDVPAPDKARGTDAPEPIRALIAARGNAPVLRWRADVKEGRLRRYAADGSAADLSLRGARGIGANAVPRYLLLVGTPAELPWSLQYRLQTEAFVGRLDLDAAGLERYVEALLNEWSGAPRDVRHPLLWCVDHGHPDITWLMRHSIADRLHQALLIDPEFDMAQGYRVGADATHASLRAALSQRQPAFVLTSSHGATFPLDDSDTARAQLRGQLGALIDAQHAMGDPVSIAKAWNPRGAIWYAHACCSAGADARSRFAGLVAAQSSLGRTLAAIAGTGACTAPLPRALLGGPNPLGAFIGHVEPTFDWTLRDPLTGQVTSTHVVEALYNELHLATRPPVGRALARYFGAVAGLLQDHQDALDAIEQQEPDALSRARRTRLMAEDCLAMVLLGDPTVRLPLPT